MMKSINNLTRCNLAFAMRTAVAFLAVAVSCWKLQAGDLPADGIPASQLENNNIVISRIGPDDLWLYFKKAFSEKSGASSHIIPLSGITADSTLEIVVADEFRRYVSKCAPGSGYEKQIIGLSDSRSAIPQQGHKAVIYGIVGFDELQIPKMKPRFLVTAGKDHIGIYDVNLPVKTFRGDLEGLDFKATPLLPEQISEFIVDGKSVPTSFRDNPFNDPDSNVSIRFEGLNFDPHIRYDWSFGDKLARLGDIGKYNYCLADPSGKSKGKMLELSESTLVFKLDDGQLTQNDFIGKYVQESKDELEKIKAKIIENSQDLKDFVDKIHGVKSLDNIKKYSATLTDSLNKKRAQLESLKKNGGADQAKKSEKLENEIYDLTNLQLKFQNQYVVDLLEEYAAKMASSSSDMMKRIKEEGKLGFLEESLERDLKTLQIKVIRKTDNKVMKTLNVLKDGKVKVL